MIAELVMISKTNGGIIELFIFFIHIYSSFLIFWGLFHNQSLWPIIYARNSWGQKQNALLKLFQKFKTMQRFAVHVQ